MIITVVGHFLCIETFVISITFTFVQYFSTGTYSMLYSYLVITCTCIFIYIIYALNLVYMRTVLHIMNNGFITNQYTCSLLINMTTHTHTHTKTWPRAHTRRIGHERPHDESATQHTHTHTHREREKESMPHTHTHTHTERERERKRACHTHTHTHTERER